MEDTDIGGPGHKFPLTSWSAIAALRSSNEEERARALESLIAAYWKPVYKYVRIKWNKSNEDAKDLTQGFFTKVIEKDFFHGYDPARARFRTFLRTCLDGFIYNEEKAAHRLKRGGDAVIMSLDFETAEGELRFAEAAAAETMEEYFEREWVRSFFSLALETLRRQCELAGKAAHWKLFERYYMDESGAGERPTYQMLATDFQIASTQVTNYLAYCRREFRRIALEKLREITGTDEEFRREARSLFGPEFR